MKLALCLILACLISANTLVYEYPSEDLPLKTLDYTDDGQPQGIEAESFSIFSSTWWAIKACLRTVKGFNCLIKWVEGIKTSALTFNSNVILCGVTASKDVTNLINANVKIINSANDIINLKSNVCADTESAVAKVTNSCAIKALAKIFSLYKQVKSAVSLAKKIPQTGPNAVSCVNDAVSTLTAYYTQFPQNIKTCPKLTS
ncbi:uncharacterized protein [Drosophila tropicalis]|uniref:uncharacterized protein n=1 Tax=Drosophila tropicalis TaxID=46794 RepID=UPI0035AB844D